MEETLVAHVRSLLIDKRLGNEPMLHLGFAIAVAGAGPGGRSKVTFSFLLFSCCFLESVS